jgi:hypothetical protein
VAHGNWHGITLQVYGAAQFFGLWRGLERTSIITTRGMHIAVARVKPLKILMDHFHQLRGYSILTVIHVFSPVLETASSRLEADVPESAQHLRARFQDFS